MGKVFGAEAHTARDAFLDPCVYYGNLMDQNRIGESYAMRQSLGLNEDEDEAHPDAHLELDRLIVEEAIRLAEPTEGEWNVEVWAAAAPLEGAKFALVVTGGVEAP